MAWFKLNDSLNTLKGQLSTVVQDVFTEGPTEEEQHDPWSLLELANAKCSDYEAEIIELRRQIQDEQAKSQTPSTVDHAAASKEPTGAGSVEDSWFWESEPPASATTGSSASSASHKDAALTGADQLTVISLEPTSHPNDEAARLQEYEQSVKKLRIENAILNEKLGQLNAELRTSTTTVEQLDREHNEAIVELLTHKEGLQTKYKRIEMELLDLRAEHTATVDRFEQEVALGQQLRVELSAKTDEVQALLAKEKDFEFIEKEKTPEPESDHSAEIRVLREQLSDYKTKTDELQAEIALLKVHQNDLQDRLGNTQQLKQELELVKLDLELQLKDQQHEHEDQLEVCKGKFTQKMASLQVQLLDQDKLKQKVAELVFQLHDLSDNRKLQEQILLKEKQLENFSQQLSDLMERHSKFALAHDKLVHDYNQLVENPRTDEEFEQFKATASECESKLVQENVVLQKQLNDLLSLLNVERSSSDQPDDTTITLSDFGRRLQQYVRIDPSKTSFDEIFKYLGETLASIDRTKTDLDELTEKLEELTADKRRVEHEKQTAQADLVHYEVEVAELMKNNEILLLELDALKTGKLETISEQNEENIIQLEQQLEDCSNLNQSLEDEYQDMRDRLADMQRQLLDRETEMSAHERRLAELSLQLENVEADKSNLAFELAELKSSDRSSDGIDELRTSEESLRAANQSLREQLEADGAAAAENLISIQGQLKTLAQKLEYAEKEKSNMEEQLKSNDESSQIIDELRATEISLRTAGESMQKQLEADLAVAAKKIVDLQGEVNSLTQQLADTNELLSKKSSDIEDLLEQLRSARTQDPNAELEARISELNQTIHTLQTTPNQAQLAETAELRHILEATISEKNQMVTLITAKHEENSTYHEEIQRLNRLLVEETNRPRECPVCPQTAQQLAALRDRDEKFSDQVTFLREKADILTANLMTEQGNQTRMAQQRDQLLAEKAELHRDVERLRAHLLEVEESHTQETMELQRTIDEVTLKMGSIEVEAKKSSTAYTSASIRANQHNETLQVQYQLLVQQRDDLLAKLSAAEDKESRSEAALINLQCALEQFQNDKERDIAEHTQKLRRQLDAEAVAQAGLHADMDALRQQLNEAKNGLLAATRISDQLENYQLANNNLKDELRIHQQKLSAIEQQMADAQAAQADKVEKGLLKNLLIGYVVAPNANDKQQVLKLISSVLDFDATESERCGLNRGQGLGWIGAIRNAALVVGNATTPGAESFNREGIAQAFVRFLEKESQPQMAPATSALLNIVPNESHSPPATSSAASTSGASSQPLAASAQTAQVAPAINNVAVQPIVLSDVMLQNFAPARNSSSILKDILSDS